MSPLKGIILFIITKLVEAELRKFTNGNVVVGAGYSGDSQQVVSQRCYNATVSSISGQQGYIQLDTALSFSELENKLGISVNISGTYGVFSADAGASYMRSLQDKDYSLSLSYYQYAANNVSAQLAGNGDEALTESGRGLYNGGKNPYFGLLCGDYYIKSYGQGALLTMGLNIKFSSPNAKKEFEEKAGPSFFDIVNATESVKTVVTKYKIAGTITVQAFQMGGERSQLAKVLNKEKDRTAHYYSLTCNLTAMDNCIKAAKVLLDYAKNKFSTQFSFKNNTGLTPLGNAFNKYHPIKYIGLIPPASLVTPEVLQYRDELFSKLKENEYYQQKLYPFFNKGYPIELDADFMNNASLILSKANNNVGILRQAHKGAADCFNFPDECESIKAVIDSQLRNITTDDLKFLEAVKYTITTRGGMLYNTGRGSSWWRAVPDNEAGKEYLVKVNFLNVGDNYYLYDTYVHIPDSDLYEFYYQGNKSTDGMTYKGTMQFRPKGSGSWIPLTQTGFPERKLTSPFFVDAYNVTKWRD